VQLIDLVVSPAPKPAPANTNPDTKPATITKNALATTINTIAWTTFPWTIYNEGVGKDDDIDISFHYSFNAFSGQSFYLPSDYLSTILGVLFDHSSTILPATKSPLMVNSRATYACSQAYALFDYSSTILRPFCSCHQTRNATRGNSHTTRACLKARACQSRTCCENHNDDYQEGCGHHIISAILRPFF
jgi:hypothetical protein